MPTPETIADVPQDFETLKAVILERKAQLPKRLKQVAAYSLDNPDEIAFGTAASIATSADVQPSTLVRFAQHFGFEGFSSLQQIFRARLRERTPGYEERLKALRQNDHSRLESGSIFNGFVAAAHRSLDNIATSVDPEAFERAVGILAKANTIYLIAKRRSYPISSYMAYAFGKLKVKYQHVGNGRRNRRGHAGHGDEGGCRLRRKLLALRVGKRQPGALARQPQGTRGLADRLRLLAARRILQGLVRTGRGRSCRLPFALRQHGLRHGADRRNRRETASPRRGRVKQYRMEIPY